MNHYRKFHIDLTEVKFRLMKFRNSKSPDLYLATEALTDAIKQADQLAGIMEQSEYKSREAFEHQLSKLQLTTQ